MTIFFFKNSNIERKLELNQLGIPGSMSLPSDNGKCMPFVNVGDGAFALSEYVLRPYVNRNSTTNMHLQIKKSSLNGEMCIWYSGK